MARCLLKAAEPIVPLPDVQWAIAPRSTSLPAELLTLRWVNSAFLDVREVLTPQPRQLQPDRPNAT